jgi:hypothetical protein
MATVPTFTPTIKTTAGGDIVSVLYSLIGYALLIIGAVALGFAIYGGFLFITSGGDSEKTTKARNTLLYAVIGVIVIALSYVILMWAQSFANSGVIK